MSIDLYCLAAPVVPLELNSMLAKLFYFLFVSVLVCFNVIDLRERPSGVRQGPHRVAAGELDGGHGRELRGPGRRLGAVSALPRL
jgi:hypothetical protein